MLLSAKFEKKFKNARNEKQKKLRGFSFSINMANFEAFWGVKKLDANLSFLKCEKANHFKFWDPQPEGFLIKHRET